MIMQNTESTLDFVENKLLKKTKRPRKKKKVTRFLVQTYNLIDVS